MATMKIELSEEVKTFVEEQARKEGFGTVSEYISALIRKARRRTERARIDALLVEGLESGPATPLIASDWAEIRHEVEQRHQVRQSSDHATKGPGRR